ncbi:MAG: hypothetical protein AAGA77_09620, partial [Bacteroidota bacterium]
MQNCDSKNFDFTYTPPSGVENPNGTITIKTKDGSDVNDFSYDWTGPNDYENSGDYALTNLEEGIYCVEVSDASCCIIEKCVDLKCFNFETDVQNINSSHPKGSIDITIKGNLGTTGPASTYTYNWTKDGVLYSHQEDINALSPGEYCVEITKDNDPECVKTFCTTIGICDLSFDFNFKPHCGDNGIGGTGGNQQGNGWIQAIPSNGSGSYSYQWSNGETTESIIRVGPGEYFVTVTDNKGCEAVSSITIAAEQPIEASLESYMQCYGTGEIDAEITGGIDPLSYAWSNGETDGPRITNLESGDYALTVTSGNGCVDIASTELIDYEETQPVINDVVVYPACDGAGGYVYVFDEDVEAYYDYSFNTGSHGVYKGKFGWRMGPFEAGAEYHFILSDICGQTAEVQGVMEESELVDVVYTESSSYCDNGSICVNVLTNEPESADITIIGPGEESNPDWEIYQGPFVSGLKSGTYQILTEIACHGVIEHEVTIVDLPYVNSPASLSLGKIIEPTCGEEHNGSIRIFPTFNDSEYEGTEIRYEWSHGATTQDVYELAAGEYTVTVTPQYTIECGTSEMTNGACPLIREFTVLERPGLQYSSNVDPTCSEESNGAIQLATLNFNYTFEWDNGAVGKTLQNLPAGEYCVTIIDSGTGCENQECFEVEESATTIVLGSLQHEGVDGFGGGSIEISAVGNGQPYTYAWSNGGNGPSISDLGGGVYNVTVTDVSGCEYYESYEIEACLDNDLETQLYEPIEASISRVIPLSETHSSDGAIELEVNDGNQTVHYSWTGPDGFVSSSKNINNLARGEYCVTITNGCAIEELCQNIGTCGEYNAPMDLEPTLSRILCQFENIDGLIQVKIPSLSQDLSFSWYASNTNGNPLTNGTSNYQLDGNRYVGLQSVDGEFELERGEVYILRITNNVDCNWLDFEVDYCDIQHCPYVGMSYKIKKRCKTNSIITYKGIGTSSSTGLSGNYYIALVTSNEAIPKLNQFDPSSYWLKVDAEGNILSGTNPLTIQGGGHSWDYYIYDENGCITRGNINIIGPSCSIYPPDHNTELRLKDILPDLNTDSNPKVFTSCLEAVTCQGSEGTGVVQTYKYQFQDASSPCTAGTILCPLYGDGDIACENSGATLEVDETLSHYAAFVVDPDGNCGCLFPPGTTIPSSSNPIYVTFDCNTLDPDVSPTELNCTGQLSRESDLINCEYNFYCDGDYVETVSALKYCYTPLGAEPDLLYRIWEYCEITGAIEQVDLVINEPTDMKSCTAVFQDPGDDSSYQLSENSSGNELEGSFTKGYGEWDMNENKEDSRGLLVHPNPFANEFIIEMKSSGTEGIKIRCYDMLGTEVHSQAVNTTTDDKNLISVNMDTHP